MRWIVLIALCLSLLCAGCLENGSKDDGDTGNTPAKDDEKMTVTITSPSAGEILTGNKAVQFEANVNKGTSPYTFLWTSNIDGAISSTKSFRHSADQLSKGGHIIILKVTDAKGYSVQSSIQIEVM